MSKPIQPAIGAQARLSNVEPSQGLGTEFLLYETKGVRTRVECRFSGDPLWHSQALIAELLQTSKPNIGFHVRNVLGKRLANKKGRM